MKLYRSTLSRSAEIRDDAGRVVAVVAWGSHRSAETLVGAIERLCEPQPNGLQAIFTNPALSRDQLAEAEARRRLKP